MVSLSVFSILHELVFSKPHLLSVSCFLFIKDVEFSNVIIFLTNAYGSVYLGSMTLSRPNKALSKEHIFIRRFETQSWQAYPIR